MTREEFSRSWLYLKSTNTNAIYSVIHGKESCNKIEEMLLLWEAFEKCKQFLRLDF